MYPKYFAIAIFIICVTNVILCSPVANLFGNFIKIDSPLRIGLPVKTSSALSNIGSSFSGILSNTFDNIPKSINKENIGRNNIVDVKTKNDESISSTYNGFKDKGVFPNINIPSVFNDVNSISHVTTEPTIEFTTVITTTEDCETTTMDYDELGRSGVSPQVLASLLG